FNVIYIPATTTPGFTLTARPSSLSNTAVNSVVTSTIEVKNSGTAPLTNLKFTSIASPFSLNSSGCTSLSSLAPGNSCTMILQYSPTAVTSAADLRIIATGDATNPDGSFRSFTSATLLISYSAITGSADISIIPNYVGFAIRADNLDQISLTFTVV